MRMLVYLFSVLAMSGATIAQQDVAPQYIASRNATLLVEFSDFRNVLIQFAAHWHRPFYNGNKTEGLDQPLATPAYLLFKQVSGVSQSHWLDGCINSIQDSEFLSNKIGENWKTVPKQELFENLSSSFPNYAYAVFDVVDKKQVVFFGFKYKRKQFDWQQELMAVHQKQVGKTQTIRTDSELEFFQLPKEGLFFTCSDDFVFGFFGNDENQTLCQHYASRLKGGGGLMENSLHNSKHYLKIRSVHEPRKAHDLFFFARPIDLLKQKLDGPNPLPAISKEHKGWSTIMAGAIDFDVNDNHIQYSITYPLLKPLAESVETMASALKPLDPKARRYVIPTSSFISYSAFGTDYIPRTPLIPGFESSISYWKSISEKKWDEDFSLAMTSVFSNAFSKTIEVGRFLSLVRGEDTTQLLRGCYTNRVDEDGLNSRKLASKIEKWSASKEYSRFEEDALQLRDDTAKKRRTKDIESDKPKRRKRKLQDIDGIETTKIGGVIPMAEIGQSDNLVFAISKQAVDGGEIDQAQVVRLWKHDPGFSFKLTNWLKEIPQDKELKNITIYRNFSNSSIRWAPGEPLLEYLTTMESKWKFSFNYRNDDFGEREYRKTAGATDVSLLTKIIQPIVSSFGKIPAYEIEFPMENRTFCLLDAMFLSKSQDSLEYRGCLRSTAVDE